VAGNEEPDAHGAPVPASAFMRRFESGESR
jgi:hypothetical protein